jgi:type I restriction enzyme S subunit
MSKMWPTLRLGDIMGRSEETVLLQPDVEYREVTVKLWGKGVVPRGIVTGSSIAASRRFSTRSGQFILSRIDARNGASGIVPPELDGAVVTNDFPLFNLDPNRVDPQFFGWFTRTRGFVELCLRASEGTTNRVRLQEDLFLALEIPLPPLPQQHRIVEQIEELVAEIKEGQILRRQASEEAQQLMAGEERRFWPDTASVGAPTLDSVCTFLARGRQSEQGESDHYLIKTQHVQQGRYIPTLMRLASHAASKVKTEAVVQEGDILIACSAAGCLGRVARFQDKGKTASTDTHVAVARANIDIIRPEYLYAYLRGAQGQHQLRSRERGDWQREKITFRLTELNLNDLREVPVPVPSLPEQRGIVSALDALQAEVDALKRLQAETSAEVDALIPAVLDKAFNGEL